MIKNELIFFSIDWPPFQLHVKMKVATYIAVLFNLVYFVFYGNMQTCIALKLKEGWKLIYIIISRYINIYSLPFYLVWDWPWCSGYSGLLGKLVIACLNPTLAFKIQIQPRSLLKIRYCREPPWPRSSVLGLMHIGGIQPHSFHLVWHFLENDRN